MTPPHDIEQRLAALSPEKRALVLQRMREREATAGAAGIPRAARTGALPLSAAQRRLWLLVQLEGASATYNVPVVLRLAGSLREDALEHALRQVVRRHETLRTTFARAADADVTQRVAPPEEAERFTLAREHVRQAAGQTAVAAIEARATAECRRAFDLRAEWPVRGVLLRADGEDPLLVLVLHHIATDGWSMGVLVQELAECYRAQVDASAPRLPDLPVQYADYAVWDASRDSSQVNALVEEWARALRDAPPALDLHPDRPRPAVATARGATVRRVIPESAMAAVRRLSAEEQTTAFSVLFGAVGAVVARHAGQDEVVLGCPLANRAHRDLQPLIGFFVNTLPVRLTVSGRPTLRELARQARATIAWAVERQSVPFDRVVDALGVTRDPSRPPLFQAVVSYQPADAASLQLPGLTVTPVAIDTGTAKFEWSFVFDDDPDGCRLAVEYNTDLFAASTAERLADHLVSALTDAASRPDTPVADVDWTSAPARAALRSFEGRTSPYPRRAIHDLFSEVASRVPTATAAVDDGGSITYGDLDARSTRIARALAARGVRPGDLVGLSAERSIDAVAGLLAILKAGAAYVPFDQAYPPARVEFIRADTQVRLVLTRDDIAALDATDASHALPPPPSPDAPAYVMYTSGSTGEPKGVVVPHRAVVRLVRDTDFISIAADDTFLLLAPLSFDASTLEIWGPLLNGARLAIAPPRQVTLEEIGALIHHHSVTTLWLTSSLFNLMVDERPDALAPLRQLLAGGDALSVPHVVRAMRVLPGRLINGYGPTENTTFTCCFHVERGRDYSTGVPIGRPIANTLVYIVDEAGQRVPVGLPGELWTGGDGVALGYLNRPELTAAKFAPNPFGAGMLYKTGDRARWRDDGTVEFLGRVDQQVKIRGFRVEPGEVEAQLLRLPDVSGAAVVVRDGAVGRELVAYAVPASGGADRDFAASVERALRAQLPDFMVPSAIVPLAALPLNANGKVDRQALPAPDRGADTHEAPRTDAERAIASLYADLLGVPAVGVHDSFFDLGGNSLVATQLVSRLRSTLAVDVPLRQVFETPDVEGLARAIAPAASGVGEGAIPRTSPDAPRPLSFAQQRLWFLNRLEPGNPFYNVAVALLVDGALDRAALEAALFDMVERHEVLRTVYRERDGQPVQIVRPARESFALAHEDLTWAPESDLDRLARDEARRPFDLDAGPVFRATLVALAEDRHALLLTIHHVAADGWSMGVLVRELSHAYAARSRGALPALPPLPIQYGDFAAWQRTPEGMAAWDSQTAYWERQLAAYPAELRLPSDRPRPSVQSFAGGSVRFTIDRDTSARLAAVSRASDATMFMTLLAAFATVLSRQAGQDDLIVGSPIAGRTRPDLEPLVGFFVNTLALRVDTSGDPTFAELLARVRTTALGAYAHQDLPFERLVDHLQPERDLSRNPLFQVMFALQNAPLGTIELPGLRVTPLDYERTTAQFDIVLDMWERPEGLLGVLEFSTALFDHSTMNRLLKQLRTVLAGVAAHPQARLSELPLLDEADRQQLIDGFNDVHAPFPVDRTIHELFEAQVAAGPGRIAAEHRGESVTYADLNARANRIAHTLRARGVARNDFVALVIERGIDLLASMLGVLKAGAAFVPVDPGYPPQRIEYMLSNSAARIVMAPRGSIEGALAVDDCLDASPLNPPQVNTARDRAYMLYTSGSTGLPKGAILRHDGKVNHIYAQFSALRFHADSAFLQTAPSSSDISVWQFLAPGLIGGRTVIVDYDTLCDPPALWHTIHESRATVIELVPVAMSALLEHVATRPSEERASTALEFAMVTGEAVSPAIVNRWVELFPRVPVVNAYGPTEAADDITQHVMSTPLPPHARSVPIGRPLANLWIYVLDERLQLQPIGVPGEICVSGIGVGEGYWRDEARTRDRFVPNPFDAGRRGAVLYRTGDLGFWRADGVLEFLSRTDEQVKLRGFRIELGEVEALLASHAAIRDAAVAIRDDRHGDKRLVAYVVANPASPDVADELARLRNEQVELWQDLHENEYRQTLDYGDPTFNVIGWDSNYTGEPLPVEHMREYVAGAVARVRSVAPRRVLEIGCGSGLILFPLVPHVESYIGTDLSEVTIRRLQELQASSEVRARVPNLDRAVLRACAAHQLDWMAPGSVDTVIFPSVLQYFPSVEYLREVFDAVMRVLDKDGAIVFGDVRSLPLLHHFYASVALFKSPGEATLADVAGRARAMAEQEQELALAPAFFETLAARHGRQADVEILPKLGRGLNEMTCFRYDAVVRFGARARTRTAVSWQAWADRPWSMGAVEDTLRAGTPPVLALSGIPNARVRDEVRLAALMRTPAMTVAEARSRLRAAAQEGSHVEPEDVRAMGDRLGYDVHLSQSQGAEDGRVDAVFVRRGEGAGVVPAFPSARPDPAARVSNDPLRERLARALAPRLRDFMKARLPHYMVPSDVVVLERMPTTPAGKVDRQALPAPAATAFADAAYVAPRSTTEAAIAGIWQEVLGTERCGLGENFFDRGGHSLKATQVVSRIRQRLGVDLPLRAIFAHPTVEELAAAVDHASHVDTGAIPRVADAASYPLSPAQRRLWILSQLEDGSVAYNMPASLELEGALDAVRLEAAINGAVSRHEALRTTFVLEHGEPRQRIADELPIPLRRVDLRGDGDALARAREAARLDAATPFDLAAGPLARFTLLTLADRRHVLLFNVHHIVSDDWSIGVLVRDVMRGYAGGDAPALRLQYRDFAAWQAHTLAGEDAARDKAYWMDTLAGDLPVLDLPADRPRPPVKTYRGRTHIVRLPRAEADALRALSRSCDSTLFMTLLAAVNTLLHRYSGQADLLVAVPVAGRPRHDLEDQIGFYVNTVVMRNTIDPQVPFRTLVAEVTRRGTEAIEHQGYPFDRLVDDLAVRRDPSRMPICDVTVVMAASGAPVLSLPGLAVRPFLEDYEASKYDLHVVFDEVDGTLRISFVYNPDLFEHDRIERMAGHLRTLLQQVATAPDAVVGEVDILAADERRRLLDAGAATGTAPTGTLAAWFGRTASAHPARLAVSDAVASLTYAELVARADALACELTRRGVTRGARVGLFTGRTVDAIVGMVAISRAGAAYVPIDPAYPADRIAFILEDAQVALVVTTMDVAPQVAHVALPQVDAGAMWPAADGARLTPPRPEDVAYLIYTSGSTGRPKGVMVTHANVTRLFTATAEWFRFDEHDVWSVFHSLAFDFSVWEIWGALLHGGRAALVSRDVARSTDAFAAFLERERITVLNQTPSAFAALIESQERAGWSLRHALRHVVFGGEALDIRSLAPWFARHGDETPRLVNMYGITETTVHVTYRPLSSADVQARSVIGRPIPDLEIRLLDAQGQLVPVGVPGEIHVGGAGVANGYWNRPELTAERFVPNPFGHGRLYKSGDLARWTTDGDLEYLGRRDHQVKVRGFRIELGEIESALLAQPGVRQALVVADRHLGSTRLVAYVAGDGDAAGLKRGIQQRLPDYMVPAIVVILPSFPLTPHGKIDRAALPRPDAVSPARAMAAPARTGMEQAIVRVLAGELGVADVSVQENFFDLGAHSLMLIKVHAGLQRELGRTFPLVALYQHPTVSGLAAALESQSAPATSAAADEADARAARRRDARRNPRRRDG